MPNSSARSRDFCDETNAAAARPLIMSCPAASSIREGELTSRRMTFEELGCFREHAFRLRHRAAQPRIPAQPDERFAGPQFVAVLEEELVRLLAGVAAGPVSPAAATSANLSRARAR